MRVIALGLSLASAGCGIQNRPTAQFSGQLTPTADAAHCPASRGTLVERLGQVVFTPNEGTWTLEGTIVGNNVTATRSRPTSDHKTFATELKATLSDNQIRGTYTTPSCTFQVALEKF